MVDQLRQIPKAKRELYQRAMSGGDRKAAMDAFCLDCCGWNIEEVILCTDYGCPLYPYRPKSEVSKERIGKKSKISNQLVFCYG